MASALQKTTRQAPRNIGAPPVRAATAPRAARKTSEDSMIVATRPLAGASTALSKGNAAPTENAAAEARAASRVARATRG